MTSPFRPTNPFAEEPESQAVPAPTYRATNPFAEEEQQAKQESARVRAVVNGVKHSPEQATEAITLSRQTGVPADVALRNLDPLRKMQSVEEFDADTFVRQNPMTSRWLQADPINPAIARDDLENLGGFEQLVGRWRMPSASDVLAGLAGGPTAGGRIFQQVQRGRVQAAYGAGQAGIALTELYGTALAAERRTPEFQAKAEALRAQQDIAIPEADDFLERSLVSVARGFAPSMAYVAGESIEGYVGGFAGGAALGALAGPGALATGAVGGAAGARIKGYNAYRILMTGELAQRLDAAQDAYGNPIPDDVKDAVSLTGGAGLALLGMYGFDKAVGLVAGASRRIAAQAVGNATATALTSATGRRVALEVGKTVLGTTVLETAQEVTEQAGLIAGESVARMIAGGGLDAGDFGPVENVTAELLETAIETAYGAWILGGVGGVSAGVLGLQRINQAKQDGAVIEALAEQAGMSKLRQRDPAKYEELVRLQTPESLERVGIEAERLTVLLQEQSIPLAQFAQVAGITEQDVVDALARGGDVYIPTPNLLARLVGTPVFDAMKMDLRIRPDGLTQREADEQAKTLEADQQAVEAEVQEIIKSGTTDVSGQRVIDDITAQITAAAAEAPKAKRFTPENIEATARAIAAFFITTGKREGIDAYELYASREYRIVGRGTAEPLYDALVEAQKLEKSGKNPKRLAALRATIATLRGTLPAAEVRRMEQAAFHGTPYTFDKFSLSAIGTGEGAQAFGWGLYFAESQDVAEGYRKTLAGSELVVDGVVTEIADQDLLNAANAVSTQGYDAALAKAEETLAKLESAPVRGNPDVVAGVIAKQRKRVDDIKTFAGKSVERRTLGALYRVDIPDEAVARMLDWDKPLSEQAPEVQALLGDMAKRAEYRVGDTPLNVFVGDDLVGIKLQAALRATNGDINAALDQLKQTGNEGWKARVEAARGLDWSGLESDMFVPNLTNGDDLYRDLSKKLGGDKEASLALLAAGIPGIKYLDAGSRGAGDGTRNLVVFDENLVTITHRNGEPVTAQERTDFLAQETGERVDFLEQSATIRRGEETLEEFGLDPKKSYTNREVASALERRQREKYGTIGRDDRSPEAMRRIAEWMVAEVEFEMQNPEGSGIGWYSEKFQAALDELGAEFPEMVEGGTLPNGDTLSRQGARDLVTAIVAITSDGADVQDNLKLAVGVYRNFRNTGTFELQRGHQREASFKGNLADITKMYRDYGAEGMRDVLLETKPIKELKAIAKARGMKFESAYQATMRMPMSAVIFGEKLGAFYANLMGQANYLTMDRWWSRTFNRYRGTLLTVPTEAGLARFKELLEADAKALAKATKTPVPVIDEEQIVSAVIKYQQEYEARGFKTELAVLVGKQEPSGKAAAEQWLADAKAKAGEEFESLYQLHELERAANTLYKAMFESLEDAPFSAKDRTFMIDTVAQARTFLGEKGFDVSAADLQAILWYYEKKLYGQLTRKKGKGTKGVSYADAARIALDATRPGRPADGGVPEGIAGGPDVADGVAGEAAIFGIESEAVAAGEQTFNAGLLEQAPFLLETLEVDGVSRPTRNSTGQPIHPTEEGIRNFWRWFGDSKVVDEQGRPLVVYHGTPTGGFDTFSVERQGTKGGISRGGFSFTSNFEAAQGYASGFSDETNQIDFLIEKANAIFSRVPFNEKTATIDGFFDMDQLPPEWSWMVVESEQELREDIIGVANDLERVGEVASAQALRRIAEERFSGQAMVYEVYLRVPPLAPTFEATPETLGTVVRDLDVREVAGRSAVVNMPEGEQVYYVADPESIKSADANSGEFGPTANILRQGAGRPNAFIMQGVSQKTIALMNGADLSSLLHEFSHDWLEILGDLSQRPNVTEQTQADYAAILKYLGVESRDQIGVPEQEKFARSFERWLATAEAPSRGLARAFVRFKSWMQRIYRMAQEMLVPVDPAIADVFARMLATDEELAQVRGEIGAEPMFTDAESAGKTLQEMADYQRKVELRTAEESGALLSALLFERSEESKKIRREREKEIRAEVEVEVAERPVYQVVRDLTANAKLDLTDLQAQFGDAIKASLPRGITASEGDMVPVDVVALRYGFRDGTAVVAALQEAKRNTEKQEVNRIVRERMAQEFPDPMERSDVMRMEAMKATHRSETDDVLLDELRTLSRTAGIRPPNVQAVKNVARQMLGKEQVKNIRPIVYQNAEATAARKAGEAWRSGDAAKAAFHKRQQLLNHILYREATKAVERVAVIERFARKQEQASAQERLGKAGQQYLEATNAILDSYEFRRVSQTVLDRRAAIAEFVKRSTDENGVVPAIPDAVIADAQVVNYRTLPYDTVEAVYETLKQIDHLAGLKNKLLTKQKQRTLEAAETAIVESIEKHHEITVRPPDYAPSAFKALTNAVSKWDAWHVKPEFLFRWLDGEKPFGAVHSLLFQPIADAQNAEARMLKAAVPEIKRLFALIPKDVRKGYDTKLTGADIPAGFTKEQAVALALNWGNASNRLAVAEGFLDEAKTMPHLTPRQIQALLGTLTKAEWDFVQGVWDYIDSFWPEIADLQRRLVGVAPEKIGADPFVQRTADGETIALRGGYYPLAYDREYSWSQRKVDAKQAVQEMADGGFARKVTKHGHTEERVGSGGKPVDLRLSIFPSHVINVIHDLTHREAIIDVRRMSERSKVRAAIVGSAGSHLYDSINPWLNRTAAEQNGPSSPMEDLLGRARVGATMVNMGFKVTTAIVQPLGYLQSIDLLGIKYARRGMQDFLKSPARIWNLVKEWSPELESRRTQFDRDVKDAVDKLGVEGWKPEVMQMAFAMTGLFDMFVAVPTFYGAYLKSMETLAPGNHDAAVKYAESMVRMSQSAGGAKDLAMIQGGAESRRMFTMFYSYFSVLYNLFRRSAGMLKQKGVSDLPRFAGSMALLWFLPAVVSEYFAQRGPEDDEDELPWLLEQVARYPFSSVIGVRDVAGGLASYLTEGRMFYDISPVVSAFEAPIRAAGGALEALAGEPMSRAELKAAVEAAGYWGKLPSRQMWITGEALYDWMMGYDIAPQDLLFPRPRQ